jgi:hypothetical protein
MSGKSCTFAPLINNSMTEIHKKYRLTSTEDPTDEMLQALMEEVGRAARESSAMAEAEKRRRLQNVANEIEAWRSSTQMTSPNGRIC